jgi:DNA-binding transcriptional MocR family regulator
MLDRSPASPSGGTLVATVMADIEKRIHARNLVPGSRLPSVRACAAALGISKSTVVEAYERLCAEGAILSRRGSGFFVAGQTRPLSLAAIGPQLDRAIDPLWLTRQSLQAGPNVLKPGSGWLPASFLPDETIRRGLRQLARDPSADRTRYDMPHGFAPLRQHLARRLTERGIACAAEQVLLTDSATQALDLICRFLLTPGDTVLVDDPCYFNFHGLLRAHRVNVQAVPYTPEGPDVAAFGAALAQYRPRFYLTNSALHNPTGATLSPTVAHRLLKLAEQHDTLIVEDDIFADFEPHPSVRLAGFDGLDRVILVGSFSKTLSGAIRCGHIALRPDWIEPLLDLKLATTLGNAHLPAALTHCLLTEGGYRRHVESLRTKLAGAMGQTIRRLDALGLKPWLEPRGGLFLWAQLPPGLDAADVARRALLRDVVLAPGNVFSPSKPQSAFLRFNVARCASPRIFDVLAEAMAAT